MLRSSLRLLALGLLLGCGLCTNELCAGEPRLDAVLMPLPKGAKARLGMWRDPNNATTRIGSVSSPDGKLLAVALGNRILVWNHETVRLVQNFVAHPYTLRGLVFAGNDTLLTQGREASQDAVKAWHATTGKMLRSFAVPENWAGTAFSHDGKLLALTTPGNPNDLHVIDTQTGKELYTDKEHYPSLFFAPDDRSVICCRVDSVGKRQISTITVREAHTGKVVRKLELKDQLTVLTGLSADGKQFVGYTHITDGNPNNWQGRWQLYDAETGKAIRTIIEQRLLDLKAFVFSPDGLLVAGADLEAGGISLWDVGSAKKTHSFPSDRHASSYPQFSHGGKTLAHTTSSGQVYLHDLKTRATRHLNPTHNSRIQSLAFTPDGRHLASASYLSQIFLWEVATGSLKQRCEVTSLLKKPTGFEYAATMAFGPDGKHLLVQQADQTVRLFAPFQGEEIRAFREAGHVYGFSEDGKHLLWSGVPLELLLRMHHTPKIVSADDPETCWNALRWVAYATWRPELQQFRCRAYVSPKLDGEAPAPDHLPLDRFGQRAVSTQPHGLSPDGSILMERVLRLTGTPFSGMGMYWIDDGTRLSDAATGLEILRTGGLRPSVVQLSPDSRSMTCSAPNSKDKAMRLTLREVRTGKTRLNLSDQPDQPSPVVFARDGRCLAFVNAKNAIEVWDLTLGKTAATFTPPDRTAVLAFSNDASLLASGGENGTILLWDCAAVLKRDFQEPPWSDDHNNRLWKDLADTDAAKAYEAIMRLKRSPTPAVTLIRDRLRWTEVNQQIGHWIEQLGSDDFATRLKATDALEQLGERARPPLVKSLTQAPSVEHKRRVELLLDKLAKPFTSPAGLRLLRSIEILDALATIEAASLLRQIAEESAADEPLRREASRALQRSTR
jgi:WD40 repeat protein